MSTQVGEVKLMLGTRGLSQTEIENGSQGQSSFAALTASYVLLVGIFILDLHGKTEAPKGKCPG